MSSRPITGGITSIAAISVTPSTLMQTVMSAVSMIASRTSFATVDTPETSATSGSNVVNSSCR